MERIAAEQERIAAASHREGLSSRELVETLVREMAEIMLGHAASLRVFMHRSAIDPEIWRRGSERSHVLANVFETSLLEHADELSHPDPELAIDVTYRFVYAALARRITHGPQLRVRRARPPTRTSCASSRTAAANYLLTGPVSSELER